MKCIYCKKEVENDLYQFVVTDDVAHKECMKKYLKKEHTELYKLIYK